MCIWSLEERSKLEIEKDFKLLDYKLYVKLLLADKITQQNKCKLNWKKSLGLNPKNAYI